MIHIVIVMTSRPETDIFTDENRLAAKDFARRSFVLLKTDNRTLPLPRSKINDCSCGSIS